MCRCCWLWFSSDATWWRNIKFFGHVILYQNGNNVEWSVTTFQSYVKYGHISLQSVLDRDKARVMERIIEYWISRLSPISKANFQPFSTFQKPYKTTQIEISCVSYEARHMKVTIQHRKPGKTSVVYWATGRVGVHLQLSSVAHCDVQQNNTLVISTCQLRFLWLIFIFSLNWRHCVGVSVYSS